MVFLESPPLKANKMTLGITGYDAMIILTTWQKYKPLKQKKHANILAHVMNDIHQHQPPINPRNLQQDPLNGPLNLRI